MKKVILQNKLAFAAGLAVVVLLVAVSYADNLSKLGNVPASSPLSALAVEISSAYSNNIITNKGIANSLASKVMDAQKALDAQNKDAAVAKLNDIIREVNAQTKKEEKKGKQITAEEATKLISLAQAAIDQIKNPTPPPAPVCNGEVMLNGTCCALPNAVFNATAIPTTPDEQICVAP